LRACGFAYTPMARFCGGCGKALAAPATVEATAQHAGPAARRRGERRRVTVLFADLKGSTAAIEGLDPEAALGQDRSRAADPMARLVDRYEGVRPPPAGRRHPGCLVRRWRTRTMQYVPASQPSASSVNCARRVGRACTGRPELRRVLYRTLTSEFGIEIDVVGPVVHVAARMEQMRRPARCISPAKRRP
jgi:hypothetical protein